MSAPKQARSCQRSRLQSAGERRSLATTTTMATSGIGLTPELADEFAAAAESPLVRFIKVTIVNGEL